ncbi:MobV family relaxase [Nostoc parmelioides]|uniref:Plasmid recombination protein n=1 Tax=Nostoc parmelioides FACHB-3921 TaxID=2692909 RepID=A0ABR8BMI6_9NOSO|nr:MobV family relaxase [Nostoc parmelioides]MBD2254775.1 plasmid recombination protein [Nostoc parmelioides FACHB-3921]
MAYAIARIKKLKRSNLAGSEAHTARQRETPNADPDKQNIRFIGTNNPTLSLDQLVMERIGEQKRKIRPDAVYCTEILLTASPEYFRPNCPTQAGYYEQDKVDSWLAASKQWLDSRYGDRIVRAELHLDEATPHIHAYFVPLDEKGQLRAKHFFDGRQKMREFQDSYSEATEHLGLERGIKGSRAQHQDIKDFYSIVNSGIEPDTSLTQLQLQAKAADRDRAQAKKQQMEATAKALALENELKDKRIKELEAQFAFWQEQTKQLRDLALEDVAWELGLDYERERWRGHGLIINIDGSKFYDFSPEQQKGGGGAIDLVMHVNQCNFRQAVVWLHERFGEAGVERAAIAHAKKAAADIIQAQARPQFTPPVENKANWPAVERYLTQQRGIPSDCLQMLKNLGLLYADDQQNAVFVMRNLDGQRNGAFLRGTRGENNTFKGYQKGTKRSDSWFYFGLGGQATDKTDHVLLCSSPIEAISRAMLEYFVRGNVPPERTLYMAVDNINSLPVERLQKVPNILVTFGKDQSTHAAAQRVLQLLPQSQQVLSKAADWNQQLLEYGRQLRRQQQQQDDDLSL